MRSEWRSRSRGSASPFDCAALNRGHEIRSEQLGDVAVVQPWPRGARQRRRDRRSAALVTVVERCRRAIDRPVLARGRDELAGALRSVAAVDAIWSRSVVARPPRGERTRRSMQMGQVRGQPSGVTAVVVVTTAAAGWQWPVPPSSATSICTMSGGTGHREWVEASAGARRRGDGPNANRHPEFGSDWSNPHRAAISA